ncbi:uncharacterized protein J3D65DRAFT_612631 [Phyllosticta citribraziliensis]|uniref:RanBD1 domain-containing protein n=1 Tax=Phyllosticta citribraziliensis TaxID=989973 RepID=A0ABR1M4Q2_9PEZI
MVTKAETARPSEDHDNPPAAEGKPSPITTGETPAVNSDNEGSERPVREKLRTTTITAPPARSTDTDEPMTEPQQPSKDAPSESPNDSDGDRRGRNRRKRSFDDIGEESRDLKVEKPSRKRSRDSNVVDKPEVQRRKTSGEKDETTTESNGAEMNSRTPSSSENSDRKPLMSPKGKRNREEFEDEQSKVSVVPPEKEPKDKVMADEQPKLKKHRESNSPEADVPKHSEPQKKVETDISKSSGFSNTSATSPFAALAASKSSTSSPQPQTSESAFKASGFGALASSSTSGFGALGATTKPTSTVFGGGVSPAKPSITGLSGGTASAFGGLSSEGKSAFGSAAPAASAFGTLGGPKLSGFGGGSGPKIVGLSEKPKAFGAPGEGDDEAHSENESSAEKDKVLNTSEEEPKDERFFEQDVKTGEENEETVFSCRAKLFNFVTVNDDKKEWKERGIGNLKLNVWKQSRADQEAKVPKKARFVMRADGSHRVVLNSPIQKELKFGGIPNGSKPTNGYVFFMGTLEGNGIELLQVKMKQANAEALWYQVSTLQEEM